MPDNYEYLIINEGSRKKAEKQLNAAITEGWELVEFRTGGSLFAYEFVILIRHRKV